jgi:isopenicillin N synthase-like dioxygenase
MPRSESLPVVDVSPLLAEGGAADGAAVAAVAATMRAACTEWGFMYITGHGMQAQVQLCDCKTP